MEKNAQIFEQNSSLSDAINNVESFSYLMLDGYRLGGSRHIVDLNQKGQYIAFLREDHRWRDDGEWGTEWSMLFGLYDSALGAVVCSRSGVVRDCKDQKMDRPNQWWNKITIEYIGERVEKRMDCGAWHLGATPYEEEVKETIAILVLESARLCQKATLHLQEPVRLSIRRVAWDEYREYLKKMQS